MTELSPLEALAAEYVLGTLDPGERQDVEVRRKTDPQLESLILEWEQRLAPMTGGFADVTPPADMFSRIEARLPAAAANDNLARLKRQLVVWRTAALGAGALAASLAIAIGLQHSMEDRGPQKFVAVLQRDAASPAFIVAVDVASRSLTVRPVSQTAPEGKSYELWLINDKLKTPRSLGVVENAGFTKLNKLKNYAPDVVETGLYAVTLEQAGGSPTGLPTSPPLFAGKLIQAAP